jgi:phosphatidylinositol-3,4,5-trisphosphate 3-phosphatase/dual-specificity protein phosphatase PTEN
MAGPTSRAHRKPPTKVHHSKLKAAVSKKKKRFFENGFDLDLSYVTPQIIAMGFPAQGFASSFRNSMADTQKFLNTRHHGNYKVYNLCSEKVYAEGAFESAGHFGADDHNPLPFALLQDVCVDLDVWLGTEAHVAAIHGKAGKGRTGTVVASALLLRKECKTAEEALNFFGMARTTNNRGVTIPSQQRYVRYYARYFDEFLNKGKPFNLQYPELTLKHIKMVHPPNFDVGGGCDPYLKIVDLVTGKVLYNMKKDKKQKITGWRKDEPCVFNLDQKVRGDVKFVFYDEDFMSKDDQMFSMTLNTGFLRRNCYEFGPSVLDGAHKDTKHKHFHPDFTCQLTFEGVRNPDATNTAPDENNTPFVPEVLEADSSSDDEHETDEQRLRALMLECGLAF